MAITWYPYGYAEILRGNIDLLTDDIRILSLRTTHTVGTADQDLADITSSDRNAHAGVVLTGRAVADDAGFTANDVTIPAGSGAECNKVLVYKHTGTDSTATVIAVLSGAAYTYTPSASTQTLSWYGDIFNFSYARGFAFGWAEILRGNIDLLTDDIRVQLIDEADHTFDTAADQDLADIAGAARVGSGTALASKAISDAGVFDSADVTVASVSGDPVEAAVLYDHTGTDGTSALIHLDSEASIEVTPNTANITVQTPSGWFGLAA